MLTIEVQFLILTIKSTFVIRSIMFTKVCRVEYVNSSVTIVIHVNMCVTNIILISLTMKNICIMILEFASLSPQHVTQIYISKTSTYLSNYPLNKSRIETSHTTIIFSTHSTCRTSLTSSTYLTSMKIISRITSVTIVTNLIVFTSNNKYNNSHRNHDRPYVQHV